MQHHINDHMTLPEIFDKVANHEGTVSDKAEMLKQYARPDMIWYINFVYKVDHSNLTVPEYTRSTFPAGLSYMTIKNAIKHLDVALANVHNPKLYESRMRLVLENVSTAEADLLVGAINGKKIEGVTKYIIRRAFPDLLPKEDTENES